MATTGVTLEENPEVELVLTVELPGRAPYEASVRQVLSRINSALDPHGPTIGLERNYGGPGVRAPN